jgi:DNA-binding MarR family transcriptional regulator
MRDLVHLPEHLDEFNRSMAEVGLRPGVGKALAKMPLDKAIPMRDLAAALRCDNSYVTAIVDSLEDRGIAEREIHPTDRRIKVVRLTDAGVLLAKRIQTQIAEPPAVFDRLTDREASQLQTLLRKLTN